MVRDLQPDVVHTHSSKAGILGRAAAWAQRGRSNRPVIVHTVHGLPWNNRQSPVVRQSYIALERFAAPRCDHLIAISPQMVEAMIDHRVADRHHFSIVPSGVDVQAFSDFTVTPECNTVPPRPVVGLVARLDPLKGHADLIAAIPAILKEVPDAHFRFIGDGFGADAVRQAVRDAGLDQHIDMQGLVPAAAMPEAYRELDVCVLPSHQEGQSRVLAEALLCGCGIVAYDVGGIPSLCTDHVTGRLVPVGDINALADAVIWMLQHPQDRIAMTARGAHRVRHTFSAQRMNADLLAIYHRLLEQT